MSQAFDGELKALFVRHLASFAAEGNTPALTLLHLGDDSTAVAWGRAGGPMSIERLALGSNRPGRRAFRHDLPAPLELEQAIAEVEDLVMPLARRVPKPARLVGTGEALQALSVSLPARASARLMLDEIEGRFNELAAVSQGRPAASSGLPTQAGDAATLLILREFMHHLGFEAITIA